jgi:hypothetical protein
MCLLRFTAGRSPRNDAAPRVCCHKALGVTALVALRGRNLHHLSLLSLAVRSLRWWRQLLAIRLLAALPRSGPGLACHRCAAPAGDRLSRLPVRRPGSGSVAVLIHDPWAPPASWAGLEINCWMAAGPALLWGGLLFVAIAAHRW